MDIKPIQTRYRGYKFRSRLEARWAVFFDALRLQWQYEPEGYDLGKAGLYLPDFYLPEMDGGCFVEVKPAGPVSDEAIAKIIALCLTTKKKTLLLQDIPGQKIYGVYGVSDYDGQVFCNDVCFNSKYLWPQLHDGAPRLFVFPGGVEDADCYQAIEAARSARFEHGETPKWEGQW